MVRKSEAVQLAEAQNTGKLIECTRDLVAQVLSNPAIGMLLCVALTEIGQRIKLDNQGHQLITDTTGNAIESIVISAAGIKSIGDAAGALIPVGKLLSSLKAVAS